jgi:hypothetical protein
MQGLERTAVSAEAGPARRRWRWVALGCGIAYFLIGISTAALSRGAASGRMGHLWRLAAWALSAVVFAAHIWHERRSRGAAPAPAAWHAALAVALGGFLLAAASAARAFSAGTGRPGAYGLALVAWPVLVGVPAFVVALLAAFILRKGR